MKALLLPLVVLLACSSSEGRISVSVVGEPSTSPAMATSGATGVVTVPGEPGRSVIARVAPSPTSGRKLLVTVTEIYVKVKRHKHKHHGKSKHRDRDDRGCKVADGDDDDDDLDDATDEGVAGDDGDDGDNDDGDGDDERGEHDRKHHRHWRKVFEGSQQIDLFDPVSTARLLGEVTVPAGRLKAIRLVLGTAPVLVENGVAIPVQCPSCTTSGFKIKLHGLRVPEGGALEITIAIGDALTTDGMTYTLHPVIHLARASCD